MKFITSIILTALLSFAIGVFSFFPWWSFAVCALIVALTVHQKPVKAFAGAFIALFFLWGLIAVMIDNANAHILSKKVAQILPLGGSSNLLILITAFIGGLVAGMAALTGSFFRKR